MINITKHNQDIMNKLYEDNKDSIIELKPNKIKIIDKIHKENNHISHIAYNIANAMKEQNKELDKIVVVRKIDKIGYVLVSGLKWYYIAKSLKCKLKCIVVDSKLSHTNFNSKYGIIDTSTKQPKDTEVYIHFKRLHFGKMIYTTPNENKLKTKFEMFDNNNGLYQAIPVQMVDDGNYLVKDKYISYLWLKNRKERYIPIKIINKNISRLR